MKRWLQENIPALYLRYTTVMRYKAAAQKLRRIAGLDDPILAAAVVEPPSGNAAVVESPSMLLSGVDAAAVEAPDADHPDVISAGGGWGVMDRPGADVAGDGCVRLRCGRNRNLDKMTRNGGNNA